MRGGSTSTLIDCRREVCRDTGGGVSEFELGDRIALAADGDADADADCGIIMLLSLKTQSGCDIGTPIQHAINKRRSNLKDLSRNVYVGRGMDPQENGLKTIPKVAVPSLSILNLLTIADMLQEEHARQSDAHKGCGVLSTRGLDAPTNQYQASMFGARATVPESVGCA